MGQDIESSHFKDQDFEHFAKKLDDETALLRALFDSNLLSNTENIIGYELEAWLIDPTGKPAPVNESYLAALDDKALFSPELSQFNIELNSTPQQLSGHTFSKMQSELDFNWQHCRQVAQQVDADLTMIGILPP